MEKCKITVDIGRLNLHPEDHKDRIIQEADILEVDAWCVDGDEGVRAYFFKTEKDGRLLLCEASGDDGFWWLTGEIHTYWLEGICEALLNALSEYKAFPTRIKRA